MGFESKYTRCQRLLASIPYGCGEDCIFKYIINLNDYGVSYDHIEWCLAHCTGKWGWYFTHDDIMFALDCHNTNLSFQNEEDYIEYKLSHII